MNRKLIPTFLLVSLAFGFHPAHAIISISSPLYSGNQTISDFLGVDFDVLVDIKVTALGVFDSDGDGFVSDVTVSLWDRSNPAAALVTQTFTPSTPGLLVGGDRFIDLTVPLFLASGFEGRLVAGLGVSGNNSNGNAFFTSTFQAPTLNDGGLISFGSFGTHTATYVPSSIGSYPTRTARVTRTADQWNAGTFKFQAARSGSGSTDISDSGSSIGLLALGLLGIAALFRRR